MNNLKFRRQFLLCNNRIDDLQSWNQLEMHKKEGSLFLYSHPDLEVTVAELNNKSLVLIGYILDPFHPSLTNHDILCNILRKNSLKEVFEMVENLNGRFVIINSNEEDTFIFNDATGFREIYYSFQNDDFYCGSTPNIIGQYADIQLDNDDSLKEFFNSDKYKHSRFWVGKRTPYENVFHLAPNFYLDLEKKMFYRYWPDKEREETSLEKGAETMARILKGTMLAASNRYELHQALSCGWDSRLLLAASKDVRRKIKYFVNKVNNLTDASADIAIPRKLARKFKIDLNVVDPKKIRIDENFKSIFYNNNVFAREAQIHVFYDVYKKKFDHTYWVTGSFSNEILRIKFPLRKKTIASYDIAKKFNYTNYRYALESIDEWLKEASDVYNSTGYNLGNMFYWEQYTGNWENLGASEGDIVREELRPFNSRKFIVTYLSLHNKYRYKDYPLAHLEVIKILWDEILKIPTAAYTNMLNFWCKRILRFIGIEMVADNVYNFLKSKIYYRGRHGTYLNLYKQ